MIARIIVGIALTALTVSFVWFMAQVIYLGVKEFFKQKSKKTTKNN